MDKTGQTIKDFGEQWTTYRDNEGYYGSVDLFADFLFPLLDVEAIKGKRVVDIGSGTGRIVNMLLAAGVDHVVAVEPSQAFEVLQENVVDRDRVAFLNIRGDELPAYGYIDYAFSFGVLHHIPNPQPVVAAVLSALRPGGKFLVWLYGKEGNTLYLLFVSPLRAITKRLPHWMLAGVVRLLDIPLAFYMAACKSLPLPLPLPMRAYMTGVIGELSPEKRRLTIYDQLNPAYAKYYTCEEAENLLRQTGFENVVAHHRHGYSWTVIGTKPQSELILGTTGAE